MRKLVTILVGTFLLSCAGPLARAASSPDMAVNDKLEGAKLAEVKGDLARIHNDYASAVNDYMAAIRVNRQNAVLYNKLGIAELQLGEKGLARKHFGQALKLDPRYTAALNNLGAVALIEKKYKPAVNYLKQALAMEETNASTHVNLAEAWIGMGDMDRGMTEYARALELDADVLSSSQEGVVAQLRTPEQRARVSFLIAKSYMKRGNIEGALTYLQRAKEGHFPGLGKVYEDPDFTALWQDPRLAKIVKR